MKEATLEYIKKQLEIYSRCEMCGHLRSEHNETNGKVFMCSNERKGFIEVLENILELDRI